VDALQVSLDHLQTLVGVLGDVDGPIVPVAPRPCLISILKGDEGWSLHGFDPGDPPEVKGSSHFLAEGEAVRLDPGIEELDLERPIRHLAGLTNQQAQPLIGTICEPSGMTAGEPPTIG
jgi:hypothetical protein